MLVISNRGCVCVSICVYHTQAMLSLGCLIIYLQQNNNNDNEPLPTCAPDDPQAQTEERKRHDAALKEYEDKVRDFEDWLTKARISNAGEPMVTYDTPYLRQQLKDNQVSRSQIHRHCSRSVGHR